MNSVFCGELCEVLINQGDGKRDKDTKRSKRNRIKFGKEIRVENRMGRWTKTANRKKKSETPAFSLARPAVKHLD